MYETFSLLLIAQLVYKVPLHNMLPIKPGTPGRIPSLYDKCTWVLLSVVTVAFRPCVSGEVLKKIFINTSDSFTVPIGGEHVTWVCSV